MRIRRRQEVNEGWQSCPSSQARLANEKKKNIHIHAEKKKVVFSKKKHYMTPQDLNMSSYFPQQLQNKWIWNEKEKS